MKCLNCKEIPLHVCSSCDLSDMEYELYSKYCSETCWQASTECKELQKSIDAIFWAHSKENLNLISDFLESALYRNELQQRITQTKLSDQTNG